ncbi:NAD(P)-binding protein [Polychaeton citri CBS 116435]|uniref:NAD(P)-binding protein n=1 Tax=Polychaeton citri CBS 116435 TaxID=1314669 RepID=A0A9P4UJ84_9PEZI|nr:NAD(P)-binding protein [Polychaeton citri CBS 116435]
MGFLYSQLFITRPHPTKPFDGQTVIITGSNPGLGKEVARHIARLGVAKVILAVRNIKTREDAREDIITSVERASVELPKSITPFAITPDPGHKSQISINVICTYLLALLMLPQLKSSAQRYSIQPRLVIVSSEVHAIAKFPESTRTSNFAERYKTSKLLEVLINRDIAPKLENIGVILNMLNPGLCHSSLSQHSGGLLEVTKLFLARSTEVGSRSLVLAAQAGAESHGKHINDGKVGDGALSAFVRSEDGKRAGERVWGELKNILERAQHGVSKNL